MKERFDNPPLLEIIAELRWDIPSNSSHPGMPMPVLPAQSQVLEAEIEGFSKHIADLGFRNAERLVPPGFPWMMGEPAFRYKCSEADDTTAERLKKSTIFQVGAGVFTANAVPPYTSWDDFEPLVRSGVEGLFNMHFASGKPSSFRPTLRYVDVFKEEFTHGLPLQEFLRDIMGISLSLPDALSSRSEDKATQVPMLHVVVPLAFGRMTLEFFDGFVNGDKAYVMDMAVHFEGLAFNNIEDLMNAFSQARNVIHETFVNLTKPIHSLMKQRSET